MRSNAILLIYLDYSYNILSCSNYTVLKNIGEEPLYPLISKLPGLFKHPATL